MGRGRLVVLGRWCAAAILAGALQGERLAAGQAPPPSFEPSFATRDVLARHSFPLSWRNPDGNGQTTTAARDLAVMDVAPGTYPIIVAVEPQGGEVVVVPPCAVRQNVRVDGRPVAAADGGPLLLGAESPGRHLITFDVRVSDYERRIACGGDLLVGAPRTDDRGMMRLTFPSTHAKRGGGVAFLRRPTNPACGAGGPLLVGLHPWNGSPSSYATYTQLTDAAESRCVSLLFPSGLGNSLYLREAEDEVMMAVDLAVARFGFDRARIGIFGASMGGAGATTIAYHRPDRFASVTSFFGDSEYDLKTYVRHILTTPQASREVSALGYAENARHLDTWLIHGKRDKVSPPSQSTRLHARLVDLGYRSTLTLDPDAGHAGPLVTRHADALVERAVTVRRPSSVPRVTFRSVRTEDRGAYGVELDGGSGGKFVDLEHVGDGLVVRRAEGVVRMQVDPPTLGFPCGVTPPVAFALPPGKPRPTLKFRKNSPLCPP
jgi:pimeloyl-ACP methyl ester carboxylesterase